MSSILSSSGDSSVTFAIFVAGVKIHEMMNRLGSDVYPKWELFATQLDMDPGAIETIRRNEHGDKMCFMRVLGRWRDSPPRDYPFSWESAVEILKTPMIDLRQLAREIEQDLT